MVPAGTHRACATCRKVVHDLSRMTAEQAAQLLTEAPCGTVCVRAEVDAQGRVRSRPGGQSRRGMLVTSLVLSLAACSEPEEPLAQSGPRTVPPAAESASLRFPPMPRAEAPTPPATPARPPSVAHVTTKGAVARVTLGCVCVPGNPLCSCL